MFYRPHYFLNISIIFNFQRSAEEKIFNFMKVKYYLILNLP